MIVEMGDYAWSEHIVTVFLACQIAPTVVQGFGANETLHFRTTTLWAQLLLWMGV
jgi:hypothetical protein